MIGNNFDRFLRISQVLELIPIGRSTLWAKIKKGVKPPKIEPTESSYSEIEKRK